MIPFVGYARRHWHLLFVVFFLAWRWSRGEFRADVAMWIAVGLAVLGLSMNLVVILANGGMPVRAAPEEIPEEDRSHYHAICQSTRLAILSDWISVGNLLISPGDIVLLFAVAILVVRAIVNC